MVKKQVFYKILVFIVEYKIANCVRVPILFDFIQKKIFKSFFLFV